MIRRNRAKKNWTHKPLWYLAIVGLLFAMIGCSTGKDDVARAVEKYSDPPVGEGWPLVADTKEFWDDVATLYEASARGDRSAFHTLLTIHRFSDGAVSENMPDVFQVAHDHPDMASDTIASDAKLKSQFGHWLEETK